MKIPIKYNVRSLFSRRGTTLMTVVSISLVVLVFVGVLALAGGLRASFAASGDDSNVLVLRPGALSETQSFFDAAAKNRLLTLEGVARDAGGRPLASGEVLFIQVFRRPDGGESNVALRGVEPAAFALRPTLQVVEGRAFSPGRNEVIVGRKLAARLPALRPGSELTFGQARFQVAGVFEAAGGNAESEIWAAAPDLQSAFRRAAFSSVLLRAGSPAAARSLAERIDGDASLKLDATVESLYWAEQTRYNELRFVALGYALAVMMAFGACFAAANTMYAQVAFRAAEIGTLRALGFRRRSILSAFLLEACVLGLFAGLVGAALSLPLNALTTGTLNSVTFSETTFAL
ncbi:MAG TPA: ABC transporter permease, partial [Thermoanaerobaculia bacterium]|nr:ABC transporter permease [Thermoanaerobaculia bacterium]